MNSELVVAIANAILALVALLGLIQFWRAMADRREERRSQKLEDWRSAFFHKYFAIRPDEVVSFQKLLSDYRVEASAYEGGRLASEELSDARLRKILLDLSRYRHIKVVGPDQYQLEQGEVGRSIDALNDAMSGVMGPMIQGLMGPMAQRSKVEAQIFALLRENPDGLTFNEIKITVARSAAVADHEVEGMINRLLAATILAQRDGCISIGEIDPKKVLAMKLGDM
jgi:hypothetical protein